MADVVGTVSAVLSLVEFTASLSSTISRFLRAVGRVPRMINAITSRIAIWQIHLDALHGLDQRHTINQHLRRLLQDSDVLGNAQRCLKRLNEIVTDAIPSGQAHSKASEVWDRVAFSRKQGEVDDLLQQMDSNTKHLQLALATNTVDTVVKLRQDFAEVASAMVSAKESDALFSWLKPDFNPTSTDPEQMQLENADLQEVDTCKWMTESTLWPDWLQGGSASVNGCRRFMWIHGLPGTGKTMLASFLIDRLFARLSRDEPGLGQPAKGFSYYYCHQEHDRDEALPFLRWVVRDLCKQLIPPKPSKGQLRGEYPSQQPDRWIPEPLQRMWQHKRLSIEHLMKCLREVVHRFHSHHNRRVYIVVDAIDESKVPRDRLLNILTTIGTGTDFENVSLLITSRHYQDIKSVIEDLPQIAFPLKELVVRTSTTPKLSLPKSTSGSRSSELVLAHGHPNSQEELHLPTTPRLSSPEKRDHRLNSESHMGEGYDQPANSKRPLSDDRTNLPHWDGRSTSNAASFFAIEELDDPPTQMRASFGKRSLAKGQGETSPTKRRLRETHVSPCTSLSMANPHVERAIALYVEKRLERCKRFHQWPRPAFLVEMRRTLAAKAGGIFRTVVCHLDMIERFDLTEESKILDCINKMPDTIFETYEKILVTLVPDGGDATREDREFARTALALMCSDTARIPDADVLISASRTTLPQLESQFYTREKLKKLLGCLLKITSERRPRTVFERDEDKSPSALLFSVAHYTVKEFLYTKRAATGPASYFAVSTQTNQRLELRIVFDGLRHLNPSPRGTYIPTRYEEYCLEMTDRALDLRPAIVEKDLKLREAVFACLSIDAPHRGWATNRASVAILKQHFPMWSILNPFERDKGPSQQATSILVNLLLLEWPELARIYLTDLAVGKRDKVWRDSFTLSGQNTRVLPQKTLVHISVSRRRFDFLKIFTAHGVHFQDSRDDVLFRAMSEPYDGDDANGDTTLALLKELLEHGADPNPQGFRVTPLQVATRYLERNWVHQLLSSGAHVQGIGESTGVDPLPTTDESRARQWYEHEPLKICRDRKLKGRLTPGMQRGVERVLERYLHGQIIVLDN